MLIPQEAENYKDFCDKIKEKERELLDNIEQKFNQVDKNNN